MLASVRLLNVYKISIIKRQLTKLPMDVCLCVKSSYSSQLLGSDGIIQGLFNYSFLALTSNAPQGSIQAQCYVVWSPVSIVWDVKVPGHGYSDVVRKRTHLANLILICTHTSSKQHKQKQWNDCSGRARGT